MLVRSSPQTIRMKFATLFFILSILHVKALPMQNGPTHSAGDKNACIVVTNDVIYQIDDITRELEEFVSTLSEKYLDFDLRLVKIDIDRHNDVDETKETMLNININDCAGTGDTYGPTHSAGYKNACIVVTNDVIYQIDDITRELEEFVSTLSEKYVDFDLRIVKIAIDRHNDVDEAEEPMLNIYINDCAGTGDTKLTYDELKTLKRKRKEATGIAYENQKNTSQFNAMSNNATRLRNIQNQRRLMEEKAESTRELSFLEMLIKNLQSYFNVMKQSVETSSVDADLIGESNNKPKPIPNIDISTSTIKTVKSTFNDNPPKVNRNIQISSTNKKYDSIESLYTINESNNNQPLEHQNKEREQILIVNNGETFTKEMNKNIDSDHYQAPAVNEEIIQILKNPNGDYRPSGIFQDRSPSVLRPETEPPKIINQKQLASQKLVNIENGPSPVADIPKTYYYEKQPVANINSPEFQEPSNKNKVSDRPSVNNYGNKILEESSGSLQNNFKSFLKPDNMQSSKIKNPAINDSALALTENSGLQNIPKMYDDISKPPSNIKGPNLKPNTALINENKTNKGVPRIIDSITKRIINDSIKSTVTKLNYRPDVINKDSIQETLISDDIDHNFSKIIASIEDFENNITKNENNQNNISDNNNNLANVNKESNASIVKTDNNSVNLTRQKGISSNPKPNTENEVTNKATSPPEKKPLDKNNPNTKNIKEKQRDITIQVTTEKTGNAVNTVEVVTINASEENDKTLVSKSNIVVINDSQNDKNLDIIKPPINMTTTANNNNYIITKNKDSKDNVIKNENLEILEKNDEDGTEQSSTTESVKEFLGFFNNFLSSFIESPEDTENSKLIIDTPVVNIEKSSYQPGVINTPLKTDDVKTVETSLTAANSEEENNNQSREYTSEEIFKKNIEISKESYTTIKNDDTESTIINANLSTAINKKLEEISVINENMEKSEMTERQQISIENDNLQPINKKLKESLKTSAENTKKSNTDAPGTLIKYVKLQPTSINSGEITKTTAENNEKSYIPIKYSTPETITMNEEVQPATENNNIEVNNLSLSISSEEISKTSNESTDKSVTAVDSFNKITIIDGTTSRNDNIEVNSMDDINKRPTTYSSIEIITNSNELLSNTNIDKKSNDYSNGLANILDTRIRKSFQSEEVQSSSSVQSIETTSIKTSDELLSRKEVIFDNNIKKLVSQTADKENKKQGENKSSTESLIDENIKPQTNNLINIVNKSKEEIVTHKSFEDTKAKQIAIKGNEKTIATNLNVNSRTDLDSIKIEDNTSVNNIVTTEKIKPLIITTDNYQQTGTINNLQTETSDSIEILKRMLNDGKYNPKFTDSNESTEQIDINLGSFESTEKSLNTESASINNSTKIIIEKNSAEKLITNLGSKNNNLRLPIHASNSESGVDLTTRVLTTTEYPKSVEDKIISEKRVEESKTAIENSKELKTIIDNINNINEKTSVIKNVIRESFDTENANSRNVFIKPTSFDYEYLTRQLGFTINEIQLLYSLRMVIRDEVQYLVNEAVRKLNTESKITQVNDRLLLDHTNEDRAIKFADEEEFKLRYLEDWDKNLYSDIKGPEVLEKRFLNEDQLTWEAMTRDPMMFYVRELK